jgi:hypothetical protein
MRRHRTPLLPLPFAGAVYVVGHGENSGEVGAEQIFLSRHSVVRAARRLLSLRKITKQIATSLACTISTGRQSPLGVNSRPADNAAAASIPAQ